MLISSPELSGTFFLLYVDPYHKQVYQHSTLEPTSGPQGVALPRMTFPISVDYDQVDDRVYWIDRDKGAIIGAQMDGSEPMWLREVPQGQPHTVLYALKAQHEMHAPFPK